MIDTINKPILASHNNAGSSDKETAALALLTEKNREWGTIQLYIGKKKHDRDCIPLPEEDANILWVTSLV